MKEQHEEMFFKDLMSKSKLELPFPEFEDTVMMKIETEELYRETYATNIKMSWICFIAGTVFGVILSVLLPQFQVSLFGMGPDSIMLGFQFLLALFVLFGLDLLIQHTRKISFRDLFKNNFRAFQTIENKSK